MSCPLWLTYKQSAELGGQVRKGEKGSLVVYADKITKTGTDDKGAGQVTPAACGRYGRMIIFRDVTEIGMFYDVVTHPLAHPIISVLGLIVIAGAAWFWWRKVK